MNILHGIVSSVSASEHLTCMGVDVAGELFHLLLVESLGESIGTKVTLAFKESEVILLKESIVSTANAHAGVITSIKKGVVISNIALSYQNNTISALVPTLIVKTIDLKEGDTLCWMVNPSEISLLRSHDGI